MKSKFLKKILPNKIFVFLRTKWINLLAFTKLVKVKYYDFRHYYRFSNLKGSNTAVKLIGKIVRDYHVIEKGLTMPDTRLGFGREKIIELCKDCNTFIARYGKDHTQLKQGVNVILEYKQFHQQRNFELDKELTTAIETFSDFDVDASCNQRKTTNEEYFRFADGSFFDFSKSRSSVRNYSKNPVPLEKILDALKLAQNTPSACNRQAWRTYVYQDSDKINEILKLQGGARGFRHLTNKLIVITAEVGVFANVEERYQAYIDGGMYAMNLLYAIHFSKIAACILNCSHSVKKDIRMKKLCGINESEVCIAMISCGNPPEEFMIAFSKRNDYTNTNTLNE